MNKLKKEWRMWRETFTIRDTFLIIFVGLFLVSLVIGKFYIIYLVVKALWKYLAS